MGSMAMPPSMAGSGGGDFGGPTDQKGTPGGGQNVSPAPGQPPAPGASVIVSAINDIISAAGTIADQFPATQPIVDQIRTLTQQLMSKIVQGMPPAQPAAPPV